MNLNRNRPSFFRFTFPVVLGVLLLQGCGMIAVRIEGRLPPPPSGKMVAAPIEIVMAEDQAYYIYSKRVILWEGPWLLLVKWSFEVGKDMRRAVDSVYRGFFEDIHVSWYRHVGDPERPYGVAPQVEKIFTDPVFLVTTVVLRFDHTDAQGRIIHSLSAKGSSGLGLAQLGGMLFGVLGMKGALGTSVTRAISAAYRNLQVGLEGAIRDGVFGNITRLSPSAEPPPAESVPRGPP